MPALFQTHKLHSPTFKVFHSPHHKEPTVSIPLKDVSDAFTSYRCCVKTHLCDPDLGHYSEEVCNQSKTLPTGKLLQFWYVHVVCKFPANSVGDI